MLENLKKEVNQFFQDIEKNIQDTEILQYVEKRALELVNACINDCTKIIENNEKRILELEKKQEQSNRYITNLESRVKNIYEDIYEENDEKVLVYCPYCNCEFDAELDDNITEIKCPECSNAIVLDWSGDIADDDLDEGCNGNCPNCGGCK